jgi:hypothetical protein
VLVIAAFVLNAHRPSGETKQPNAQFVVATGKCAE